jgi:nucleotide-binding universal stress UspA family protein
MYLLVATDGSEQSRLAVAEAARLAAALQAEATVLTVSQVTDLMARMPLGTFEFTTDDTQRRRLETPNRTEVARIQVEAAGVFQQAGAKANFRHAFGDPADVILEVAHSLPADLILVGTRGYTGITRFLMGSVAEKVMRYAPCSVLVSRGRSTVAIDRQPDEGIL